MTNRDRKRLQIFNHGTLYKELKQLLLHKHYMYKHHVFIMLDLRANADSLNWSSVFDFQCMK